MFQLEDVIESKFPAFGEQPEIIARPMMGFLKKLLREDEVNAFLAQCEGLEGFDFIEKLLDYLNCSYNFVGRELENIPAEGRVVIVANHPLGLLDGVALLKTVGQVRRDVRIVANDVLMAFEPLRSLLLPVVNVGAGNNRSNVGAIREALERDEAVIIFPSGEVSRAGPRGIRDGPWSGGFLKFAEHARAPVLPVHVGGRNSALFYGLSTLFRPLSTLMLLREPHHQRGATLPIRIGRLIPWKEIAGLDLPRAKKIQRFNHEVYSIGKNRVVGFKTETPVAHPEDRLSLRRELRAAQHLGRTHDGKHIYLFDAKANSAVMRELGRLREIAFRQAGEGTGKKRDLDRFDAYYRHVLLWDDSELQIVGAYRIGEVAKILEERGPEGLYTHGLFSFGEGLRENFAQSLELGRSFVQPRYQGMRALEYLWYGIGAYLATRPDVRYLFGPVSLSASYPDEARQMLVYFYRRYFGLPERLATERTAFVIPPEREIALARLLPGEDYDADFRTLKQQLAALGHAVPTLFKQYTELCDVGGTRFLAFNVDAAFANCVDGLVWVDLLRLKPGKRERYLGEGRRIKGEAPVALKSA
jgi:putative hemolysin